jgi:hypothetical protein
MKHLTLTRCAEVGNLISALMPPHFSMIRAQSESTPSASQRRRCIARNHLAFVEPTTALQLGRTTCQKRERAVWQTLAATRRPDPHRPVSQESGGKPVSRPFHLSGVSERLPRIFDHYGRAAIVACVGAIARVIPGYRAKCYPGVDVRAGQNAGHYSDEAPLRCWNWYTNRLSTWNRPRSSQRRLTVGARGDGGPNGRWAMPPVTFQRRLRPAS